YTKGLGVHAISQVVYNLNQGYTNFLTDVGLDDEEIGHGQGSVVFQVLADSVKIYDSGVMTQASPTPHLNLNVTGVQQLTLMVGDAGDGNNYDHSDWAGARLLSGPPAAPSNLVTTVASTQANLTWNDNSGNETGFKIDRATDSAFTQNLLTRTVAANSTN